MNELKKIENWLYLFLVFVVCFKGFGEFLIWCGLWRIVMLRDFVSVVWRGDCYSFSLGVIDF